MKKTMFIMLMAFFILCTTAVYAKKMAVKSDIKAYIDYTPIRSYNIDGYTYVIAEELRSYGYDVVWNPGERSLRIERKSLTTPIYTKELADADSDKTGLVYKIYDTDIVTYLGGNKVNSYNIGGRTVIQIDELAVGGSFWWNNDKRRVDIKLFEEEVEKLYESTEEKTEIDTSDYPRDWYNGQVNENGQPHGIGRMEKGYNYGAGGVSYTATEIITGYFNNGKPAGNVHIYKLIMSGKTGIALVTNFIGKVDGEKIAGREFSLENGQTRENNFGETAIPYFYYRDYADRELFPDTRVYGSGVWYEEDGYRGQEGVTYTSWLSENGYQNALKTEIIQTMPAWEFIVLAK